MAPTPSMRAIARGQPLPPRADHGLPPLMRRRPSTPLVAGVRRRDFDLEPVQVCQLLAHQIERRHIRRAQAEFQRGVAIFDALQR